MSSYDMKILFGILGELAIAFLIIAVLCFCGVGLIETAFPAIKGVLPSVSKPSDPARPPGNPDDYILVQTVEGGFVWMKIR